MRTAILGSLAVAACLAVAPARAASATKPEQPATSGAGSTPPTDRSVSEPSTGRRVLSAGAAVFPGVIVHGSGHYVMGQSGTARKLLLLEGIGVGSTLVGIAGLALTGASRYTTGPFVVLTVGGMALFTVSWLADIYGVVAPAGGTGRPQLTPPLVESELGYRYVYDPVFAYRDFVYEAMRLSLGRWQLDGSAWLSLNDSNSRYRGLLGYRAFGPLSGRPGRDGSFLDAQTAITHHRYDSDGFNSSTLESAFAGRLDLVRVDDGLQGSFAEARLGVALSAIDYEVPGLSFAEDVEDQVLVRFAFGMYLGDVAKRGGEFRVYYDHRHDDFAAGLKLSGLGSGAAGHLGTDLEYYFDANWGARAEAQIGSAAVAGVSLLYRTGGQSP